MCGAQVSAAFKIYHRSSFVTSCRLVRASCTIQKVCSYSHRMQDRGKKIPPGLMHLKNRISFSKNVVLLQIRQTHTHMHTLLLSLPPYFSLSLSVWCPFLGRVWEFREVLLWEVKPRRIWERELWRRWRQMDPVWKAVSDSVNGWICTVSLQWTTVCSL